MAFALSRKISRGVLETILEPLHAIEDVVKELTEGNLHSTLDYHSDDEIGRMAHNMRKPIRILGSYVDDIDWAMKLFSEGATNQAAVVANQVNVLADQSAQAAKKSAALIETSVHAVEKGMVIAGETATRLEDGNPGDSSGN